MNANTINSKNVISGVNDLATKCPKISAMWSAKNTYTPSEVSVGSNKKAWFVCPDCKQEFEARVFHIARSLMRGNTGCPVCAGLKVVPGINDLATKCPKIFAMWSAKNTYPPPAKHLQAITRKRGSYAQIVSRSLKLLSAM